MTAFALMLLVAAFALVYAGFKGLGPADLAREVGGIVRGA